MGIRIDYAPMNNMPTTTGSAIARMSEYIIHIEDAKTIYGNADFLFPLDAYLREKIVRCKDCKSYQPGMYKHFTCEYLQRWVKPDDFCAWPTRKERIKQ